MTIQATLCYIFKEDRILLQKKSKELFGGDKYNAPGGKLKEREKPEEGVVREVEEETGLRISNLNYHGILNFYLPESEEAAWKVHVFSTSNFAGELKENHREGCLEWIAADKIPYNQMWEDDKYFVPLLLEGKRFEGHFWFSRDFGPLREHRVKVLE